MIEHVNLNINENVRMVNGGDFEPTGKYSIFIEIRVDDEYACDKAVKRILGALGE